MRRIQAERMVVRPTGSLNAKFPTDFLLMLLQDCSGAVENARVRPALRSMSLRIEPQEMLGEEPQPDVSGLAYRARRFPKCVRGSYRDSRAPGHYVSQ